MLKKINVAKINDIEETSVFHGFFNALPVLI